MTIADDVEKDLLEIFSIADKRPAPPEQEDPEEDEPHEEDSVEDEEETEDPVSDEETDPEDLIARALEAVKTLETALTDLKGVFKRLRAEIQDEPEGDAEEVTVDED